MIKDSGSRTEYESGAVRDLQSEKGRCDLLPLGVIANHMNNGVLMAISSYMDTGDLTSLYIALDKFIGTNDKAWADAMLDVSIHYKEGALKYCEHNWEKGIPLHSYIDSAIRHYFKYLRGDDDERHDRAFIWNILGAIWTHLHLPNMIDLPFFLSKEGQPSAGCHIGLH